MQLDEAWGHSNKIWINKKECASKKIKRYLKYAKLMKALKIVSNNTTNCKLYMQKKGKSFSYHLNTKKDFTQLRYIKLN